MGRLWEVGIRPVRASSWGSRTSMRIREGLVVGGVEMRDFIWVGEKVG